MALTFKIKQKNKYYSIKAHEKNSLQQQQQQQHIDN